MKNKKTLKELCKDQLNLATALVPSEIACLANSPGRISLTAD
jgi:hypothetical protein